MADAVYNVEADVEWPSVNNPSDWRDFPDEDDEDETEDDEDVPADEYIKDVLGVDPDELFAEESDGSEEPEETDDEG